MDCLFCLEPVDEQIEDMFNCKCRLYFHKECMKVWLNNGFTCPICKKPPIIKTSQRHNTLHITFTLSDIIFATDKKIIILCIILSFISLILFIIFVFKTVYFYQ